MSERDDNAEDEREARPFHRCTGPAADHCRKCSYLPEPGDDNEDDEE